ncbi:cation diffusion facilitator family transporter [Desulfolutivibrio sulfoxidireducens]|nr:cation diffusion facilitator family transporter [Desulfolutivibrio sulfoxidireducens]
MSRTMSEYEARPHPRAAVIAASASLAVGALLLGIKFLAYSQTGSSAILSDALESIVNVVAASFALISVVYAAAPPDSRHPYGHGTIEFFAAGFEGGLIIVAGCGIIWESFGKIFSPVPLANLDQGLVLLAGAGVINLLLGLALVRSGKRLRSLTLTADGKHVLTDVITSAGVLVGLVLVRLTDVAWLDPAVACLVAANILFTGYKLMRQAFAGLMREADPRLLDEICLKLSARRKPAWIGIHRLRAWRSGSRTHIDFHLILPRDLSLEAAHAEVREVEDILYAAYGSQADLLIHADPCREAQCPECGEDPCRSRARDAVRACLWFGDTASLDQEEPGR